MRKCKILLMTLLIIGAVSFPTPSRADVFAKPALDNLVKLFVRYGALDIRSDQVMDLYGSIMVCDLYREFYRNDFKWNEIRGVLREQIKKDVGFFPTGFQYDAVLQLGKYDFKNSIYRFSRRTANFNANVFKLSVHSEDFCGHKDGLKLPNVYPIILNTPVQLPGIPMGIESGKKLYARMEANDNKDHLVYVRFRIRATYVAPFVKKKFGTGPVDDGTMRPDQDKLVVEQGEIRIDGELDSVEFYEDQARTRMIYKQEP